MSTLVYIALLGFFSYQCTTLFNNFRGSSELMKCLLGVTGLIGTVLYLVTVVWSFWHYTWWMPIVAFIASIIFGSLISATLFQGSALKVILGTLLSPVCVVVFSVLSIIGLC